MSTLTDVAKLAGVGEGTASRALSGRGYVDDVTKSKVQHAAAKLKYRRNVAAGALHERRSRVVESLPLPRRRSTDALLDIKRNTAESNMASYQSRGSPHSFNNSCGSRSALARRFGWIYQSAVTPTTYSR